MKIFPEEMENVTNHAVFMNNQYQSARKIQISPFYSWLVEAIQSIEWAGRIVGSPRCALSVILDLDD